MPDTNTLTPIETAVSRQRIYTLFSRLFLEGLTPELLDIARHVPELAAAVPTPYHADEAAASHYQLFQRNLYPYESFFLTTNGLLGGPIAGRVTAVYQQNHFTPPDTTTNPDHIGIELAFMAHLCKIEAQELGIRDWKFTPPISAQRSFLQTHLLRWLPPLVLAIHRQANPFYTALADLMLAFAAHDAQMRQCGGTETPHPHPPALLENDKTGLKEIARVLTTPCYTGMVIGRTEVTQLGQKHRLPRGFGSRTQLMSNLLYTAVSYDTFPALLQDILTLLENSTAVYTQMATDYPQLAHAVRPWQTQCQNSHQTIQQLLHRVCVEIEN
ncbi:MAG: molecular chaperone TorD family protein [Candidatus Promineifilaceae bacterium]